MNPANVLIVDDEGPVAADLRTRLNTLSQVNQAIAQATSPGELLAAVCRAAVEGGRLDLAWVTGRDPETGRLTLLACFGRQAAMLDTVVRDADRQPPGLHVSGAASGGTQPCVCNDCRTEPCSCLCQPACVSLGFGSCASFSLQFQGQPWAVLCLCAAEPGMFGERKTALFAEVTQNVSGALDRLETGRQKAAAEAALQRSEERFRLIADSTPDSIWVMDSDLRFTYVSPSTERLFGYTVREWESLDWRIFVHPDHQDTVLRLLDDVRQRQGAGSVLAEVQVRHKEGREMWVEFSATPLRGPTGEFAGAVGISRDVTDRKRAEGQLRDSEHRFHAMFRGHSAVMLLIDPQSGAILDANTAAQDFYGYPLDTLRSMAIQDVNMLAADEVAEQRRWAVHEQQSFFVFPHRLANGGIRTVEVHSSPITIGGRVILFSIIHDITERQRAEEKLRDSLQTSADIVRSIPSGFFVYQFQPPARLMLLSANPEAERLTGIRAEQWLGREFNEIWPAGRKLGITDAYLNALRSGVPFETEDLQYSDKRLSGAYRIRAFALSHDRLAVAFEDVTERKRAEAERERLQAQLTQAQKMESVGRLAGGVAHDFNNMLQAILGNVELALQETAPTDAVRGNLEEIRESAQRSADLTRQLLAFARKQTIAPKVFDLNESVEAALKMLRRLIGEAIDLVWLPGRRLGPVKMDPTQVGQVLANLCVNARDAIAGVGKITIETASVTIHETELAGQPDAEAGDYVRLTVSDTGCGMDQETLASLFEPFFTTKEVGRGTGLGLATVLGIVQQNRGFVRVTSEPNRGTTFYLYWPRYHGEADRVEPQVPDAPPRRAQATILLVEDEPAILRLAKRTLENLGYVVLAALTPGEALRAAEAFDAKIDLLLTDVVMPEMTGRELADHLQARYPQIRRLFMSGYTADVIAYHGVVDPHVHFLEKPFTIRTLADQVRAALDD